MIPPHVARWALDRERQSEFERALEDAAFLTRKRPHAHNRVMRLRRELRAEPVSISIGLSAFLFNTGLFASVGAASAFGGGLISLGATFALSAASSALQRSNQNNTVEGGLGVGNNAAGLSQTVRRVEAAPLPDQRLVLGTVTQAGVQLMQSSTPPYLWYLFDLAGHECGDFVTLFANGTEVVFDAAGKSLTAPFYNASPAYIELSYRNGTAWQEIDPIISRDFSDMPDTFRQRRHTTACVKLYYGASDSVHQNVWGTENRLNLLFRHEGAKVYDPRVPGCLVDDDLTWVASQNAPLNIARALYHPWPNMRWLEPGKIDWDLMAEAADIADRRRGLKDATTEALYECSGVVLSSADPVQMLREMLTSCDGLLIGAKGKYSVLPGWKRDPVATLDQDMLAGGFELHTETPDREQINICKTEFIAPDRDYKPVVGPVLKCSDLIAVDGQPLETTLTLPFTEGDPRAQYLAAVKVKGGRGVGGGVGSRKRSLSATFNIRARRRQAGDVVRISWRDFPQCDGIYQIQRTHRDQSLGRVQIDMVEFDAGKYDYDAPSEQQDFALDDDVLSAEAA